jgi:hypothetical protein
LIFRVEKNAQSRIEQIAEVIAELKDPMTVEPDKVLEAEPMDVTEVVDQKLIRSLNLEIAKLRVDMTSNQESLDMAIAEQDFVKVYTSNYVSSFSHIFIFNMF